MVIKFEKRYPFEDMTQCINSPLNINSNDINQYLHSELMTDHFERCPLTHQLLQIKQYAINATSNYH